MALVDRCKEFGWHLSEEGIKQIVENGTSQDVKAIIKKALDIDLRDISTPSFPEDIARAKYDNIPGHIVVQVQKVRNVSAPKANEESQGAPRMLKITLTDGHTNCLAVEMEQIASLSLNTPPGTKIFLKTETLSMAHGYLLIGPEQVQVLGGKVAVLFEKWELNRSLAKHVRGRIGEEGGPPPWISFGQKILRANPQDRHFKSLESKDKENRGDSEFDAQRKDAIAEASRAGAKKVFGGGHKPLLDHNVQQIVDYGFTVEQAENALKQSRNNVEKALKNLQRSENRRGGGNNNHIADGRTETKKGDDTVPPVPSTSSSTSRRKGRDRNADDDIGQQKPSGRLSLFDFLEDKLPASIHTEKPEKSSNTNEQRRGGPRGGGGGRGSRTTAGGGSGRTGGSGGGGGSRGKGSRSNNNNHSGGSVGVWSSDSSANVPISSSNKHQLATSGSNNSSSHNNHFHYNQHHPAHRGDDSNKGQRYSTLSNVNPSGQQKPPRFQNQQHQQYKQSSQQHHQTHHQQQTLSGFYNDSSSTGASSSNNTWSAFNNNALDNLTSNWPARYGSSTSPSAGPTTTSSNSNNDLSSSNRIRATQQAPSRSSMCSSSTNSAFGNNFIDSRVFNNHQDAIGQQPKVSKSAIGQGYVRSSNNTQHQHLLSDFANYNNKDSSTPNAFRGSLYQGVVQQTENINTNNSSTHYLRFPGTNSQEANNCVGLKPWVWSKGDKCMAKYWEDDRYCNAEVTGVSQRTCVVRFLDYGNFEEVLQDDCIPYSEGS